MSRKAKQRIIAKCSVAVLLVLLVAFFFPRSRYGKHGTGSMKYARIWKDKLAACNSVDDVRKKFNCGRYRALGKQGSGTYIEDPNTFKEGNTWALLYDLPNGDWLAMAYASSHGWKGGGTVVTRDSTGRIRVFFGHVCGRPLGVGETLEEIYASFEKDRLGNWKEVSLAK